MGRGKADLVKWLVPENGKKGQRNQIVNVYCLGARALKTADGREKVERMMESGEEETVM